MSVVSGILGAVNGMHTVRTWEIGYTADTQKYVASNTLGGAGRIAGNQDWSGNFSSYGHTPPVFPGESFLFSGTIDELNGAEGQAIVDSVEITIDIEAGTIIGHVVNFSSDGELYLGPNTSTDVTIPDPPTAICTGVALGVPGCCGLLGSESDVSGSELGADSELAACWELIDDVRTVTITLEADNQAYVSSSTCGHTRRTPGNFDWNMSITLYTDDFDELPEANLVSGIRVYVDAAKTEYWEFCWGIFGDASGLEVDREGASPVGATLNLAMTGFTNVGSDETPSVGHVLTPAGDQVWPD